MGPINWLAAGLSAIIAMGIAYVWYGALFGDARMSRVGGRSRSPDIGSIAGISALQLLSAVMMAHNYARLGSAVMAAKPWLYWMQSGGIAIAFIVPALLISSARRQVPWRDRLVDAGYWVMAYLSTGTCFWFLR